MPPPKTGPTTTVVRLPKAQVAAAEAATGLRGGQAVRAALDGATATEDRILTLEELAVLTDRKLTMMQAAIARLEGARSPAGAREATGLPSGEAVRKVLGKALTLGSRVEALEARLAALEGGR